MTIHERVIFSGVKVSDSDNTGMFPRSITTIKQIELTSKCNLSCKYCPHPKMKRKKEHMPPEVLTQTLKWVEYFMKQGTQQEVALTGIGEPLMYPEFIDTVRRVREVIGWRNLITFSTNGILLTDELCKAINPYKPFIFVSTHRPEKAGPAIEIAKKYGLFCAHNEAFATDAMDWAGTVNWYVSTHSIPCAFLQQGWAVVLADGDITTCCMDSEKLGKIGDVFRDTPGLTEMKPYELCETCHMSIPETLETYEFIPGKIASAR